MIGGFSFGLQRLRLIRSFAEQIVVKTPFMAESITSGTLASWEKAKGDWVDEGENVASIETDKVEIPVNSPVSGTIQELYAKVGDNVAVGSDLFKVQLDGGDGANKAKQKQQSKEPLKSSNENATNQTKSSQGQIIQPKSISIQESSSSQQQQQQQQPKTPRISFGKQKTESSWNVSKESTKNEENSPIKSSIALANESDSSLNLPQEPSKSQNIFPLQSSIAFARDEIRIPMSRMRLRITEKLQQSQSQTASLTTFNEVDMSAIQSLRSQMKDEILSKYQIKLGFMSFFVKACAIALAEIPAVNAQIQGNDIVQHNYADICVAVATPKGLVTPVVKDCQSLSMLQIEQQISLLAQKAKEGKITLEELSGGTFTISNGGVFGSLSGTPILNYPQAAILGMHAIKQKPVVLPDGNIAGRPMMNLALTYDHRIIDGREAVTFLVRVKQLLEEPNRILFTG